MTEWITSENFKDYNFVDAFHDLKKVDYRQNANYEVGDIIYIYSSGNEQMIRFKCKVNKIDINELESADRKCYGEEQNYESYDKYVELEMIEEYNNDLYSRQALEKHGFTAQQGAIKVKPEIKKYLDIVTELLNASEMDPDKHDGSYELARETVRAYKNMGNLDQIDFKDMNLIYHMVIGTWRQKVDIKKKSISESHLPDSEKSRLTELLDKIWENANNNVYSNREGDASIGMFGTAFYSFYDAKEDDSIRFIQMCIDILDNDSDEEMFEICQKALSTGIPGMQAASASVILHCLRPTVFPILNGNSGYDNIYKYFGVKLEKVSDLSKYIGNCRKVKEFRDKNFTVKNYRIFDLAARKLGYGMNNTDMNHTDIDYLWVMNYLEQNGGVSYSKPNSASDEREKERLLSVKTKGQRAKEELQKMAKLCAEKFKLNKCETIQWLDGSNTKTKNYLWAQLKYSEYAKYPESISIFVEMSEKTKRARFRFSLELKNEGADEAIVANYHRHFDIPIDDDSSLCYVSGSDKYGSPKVLDEDVETIKSKVTDGTYKKVQICSIVEYDDKSSNDEIEEEMLSGVNELIPYYEHVLNINNIKESNVVTSKFDKNIILYGPPGTGKTYNTAIYAVAICDKLSLDKVKEIPYEKVLDRYRVLKDEEKRVAFTTFHQSYGYEEFIEGIKPKMDSDSFDVEYTIKDGVFKDFCDRASKKKISSSGVNVGENARVWNVILGGNNSDLKKRCFNEGTIRIGWPNVITDKMEGLNDMERRIILNFQDEMKIGDVVVTRATNEAVDGVAIITGEVEFDTSDEYYPRKRRVQWLYKGANINIIDLNGGTRLDRKSVYPLNRISVGDLLSRVPTESGVEIEDETRPFVFIIDEINRGNISKIFGELITLIEPTKRKGAKEAMEVTLPYSNVPFGVPNNVYLIGTMNTADRSIAIMDTALRRRFQFEEMMPNPEVLGDLTVVEGDVKLNVAAMLTTINKRIEYLFDREHTIGHAFFTGLKDEPTVAKLADIFKKSVIPLLQEYFYEDYSKIRMVLGDNGKENMDHMFIRATKIEPKEIFRGDTSDIDIPDYSYVIQDKAFDNIMSYKEIMG